MIIITKLTSISLWLTYCFCLILCCNSQPIAKETGSAPQTKFLGLGAGGLFGSLFSQVDVSGTWSPSDNKPGKPSKKKKPHKRPGHGGGGVSGGDHQGGGFLEDLIGSWILSDLNYGCKKRC